MLVVKDAQAQAVTINPLDFSQGERDRIDLSSLSTTRGTLPTWQDEPSGSTMIRVRGTNPIRLVGFRS